MLAGLASGCAVAPPHVRIKSSQRFICRVEAARDGSYTLIMSTRVATETNDDELVGLLGHELQHVAHDDRRGSPTGLTVVTALVAFLTLGAVLTVSVSLFASRKWWWCLVTFLLGVALIMLPVTFRLDRAASRWRHDGEAQPVIETRNDLAAVSLVGRKRVLAALRYLADDERAPSARSLSAALAAACQRFLGYGDLSHPPIDQRIATVQAFDPSQEPLMAARKAVGHQPFRWSARWW